MQSVRKNAKRSDIVLQHQVLIWSSGGPARAGRENSMQKSTHEMLESSEFKHLIGRRWKLSIVLLFLLFVIYYGYILLIGYDKAFLAQKIGQYTTLGIPLGVLVIIGAWLLTFYFVHWNNAHDIEIERLKREVKQ
jgi:uncharacterized membrane protein (DUF485 family)